VRPWAADPLLVGKSPDAFGANGLAFTRARPLQATPMVSSGTPALQEFLYVSNSDFGRIVRIPVLSDGSAGTAEVFFEDANLLTGANGIAFDSGPFGGTLFVAVTTQNRLVAISAAPNPQAQKVLEGASLQAPESVAISRNQLYVTSNAFDNSTGGLETLRPALQRVTDQPLPIIFTS
jgi:sugar lactone lactonase YvrE